MVEGFGSGRLAAAGPLDFCFLSSDAQGQADLDGFRHHAREASEQVQVQAAGMMALVWPAPLRERRGAAPLHARQGRSLAAAGLARGRGGTHERRQQDAAARARASACGGRGVAAMPGRRGLGAHDLQGWGDLAGVLAVSMLVTMATSQIGPVRRQPEKEKEEWAGGKKQVRKERKMREKNKRIKKRKIILFLS